MEATQAKPRRLGRDDADYQALVQKCQENGWLMRGGYDWQDDPYLEEYPYEFSVCEDIESLRATIGHGNWAIRQGFLYEDLAFIQQVNGGDEWWTLKRTGDHGDTGDWLAFDSWSFGNRALSETAFNRAIRSMQMATPEQCRKLSYMLPEEPRQWDFATTVETGFDGEPHLCRSFASKLGAYRLSVYEKPSTEGFATELFDTESRCILRSSDNEPSAIEAAKGLIETAGRCREHGVHSPRELSDLEPLAARTAAARSVAQDIARTPPSIEREIRR